jgi:hypothetical protein
MSVSSPNRRSRQRRKVAEALAVLDQLGLPRAQKNERSALTLLALLDLRPDTPWADAKSPLCGITPMMEFFAEHYGKKYKPNTRETVRRQTVHQFLDAGLILINPDRPDRPVNSPKAVYQVEPAALSLLRAFETPAWAADLASHLTTIKTLRVRYAQERDMTRIPVLLPTGKTIALSPGAHNVLIRQIVNEFAPRFAPGGKVLYVGDTGEKFAYFDEAGFAAIGLAFDSHGKMPDVVIQHVAKHWLLLVEAVTAHGPVNPKRKIELVTLFRGSRLPLVFVTAFPTRPAMVRYLSDISWETEVWVAESPSHLIHFDGERFLGPY